MVKNKSISSQILISAVFIFFLALACISFVIGILKFRQLIDVVTVIVTGAALLVAIYQAKSASQQAEAAYRQTEKTIVNNVMFNLYELYSTSEMHQAIKLVWQTMKQDGNGKYQVEDFLEISNRYEYLRKYLNTQEELGKRDEFDEARRKVTHFWYLIANLISQGTIEDTQVFEWFGPPDVIWVLEGLEVITQQKDVLGSAEETYWPPLIVLHKYYASKGIEISCLKNHRIPIPHVEQLAISKLRNWKKQS